MQLAVDLDAEVHVIADRLAVLSHRLDGVAHLRRVGLEVGLVARVIGERRQVPDRREALRLGVDAALHQLLARLAEDVVVDAGLVARLAAHQLVARHAEVLPGDVPERDVDRAKRAHDRRAPEVGPAVHVVPVVLDPQRILPDQVALEGLDRRSGRLQEAPGPRLAQPDDPRVGVDLHEEIPIHVDVLDLGDLHDALLPAGGPRGRPGGAGATASGAGVGVRVGRAARP